jgi:hypothetical protein
MTANQQRTRTHLPLATSHQPLSCAIGAAFIGNNGNNQRKTS